jgi:predicted ATPase
VTQLQKGLRLLTTMPSSPGHQQELDLRIALGPALIATRGYSSPEVGETYTRASALAEQIGQSGYLLPLLYGQWAYHLVRSEHRLALPFAERMEKIGEARKDSAALLLGHLYHGIVRFFLGEFAAARALFEQCHGLRDPVLRQTISKLTAEDGYSLMLGYLAATLGYLGYFNQARSRVDEGLSEARGLHHVHTLGFALFFKCFVSSIAKLTDEVREAADEMFELGNEHGFPLWTGWALVYRGLWSTAVGHARDGVSLMTQAFGLMQVAGAMVSSPFVLAHLGEAFARLAQPAEGLSRLREAAHFIDATDERYHEAEVHRLQGDLLKVTGDHAAAEQSYRQALAVAGRQDARAPELRAATGLARLWHDQGKVTEARDLLAPVYSWFTEGFDTLDLKGAKALLDELAS